VQNYLWWNACLCFLLLHDRLVESLLHLFVSHVLLLHYYAKLLGVCLHHLHCLIVHVHIGHLCVRRVVCVIVRFEMPAINVICYMSLSGSKVLNEIPLLQGSVPHHSS
jgi:hypothetical protein